MKKNGLVMLFAACLLAGSPAVGLADIPLVKRGAALPAGCKEIGKFEADAGYGKQLDGKKMALRRAAKKAAKAGADMAVVLESNNGPSGLNGYCRLLGYDCPSVVD